MGFFVGVQLNNVGRLMLIEWVIRWVLISLFTAVALPRFHAYLQTMTYQPILQELQTADHQIHAALGELKTESSTMDEWPHLPSPHASLPLVRVAPAVSAKLLASSSTFTTY